MMTLIAAAEKEFVTAIKLATLDLRLHALAYSLELRHWSTQPRVPAGSERGGEWMAVEGAKPIKEEELQVAFGAILKFQQGRVQDPVLGSATKCFYRDILDRWFAILVGVEKDCPPTYPADPTG